MCKLPWYFKLAFIVCWPAAVMAQDKLLPLHIYEAEGTTVNLMPSPCVDPFSLRVIRAEKRGQFRAVESIWRMRDGSTQSFYGCWVEEKTDAGEDAFFIIFNDGEHFLVPKAMFDKRKGQVGI